MRNYWLVGQLGKMSNGIFEQGPERSNGQVMTVSREIVTQAETKALQGSHQRSCFL